MITVAILGGLGNQMFQYAAGKALACRHGVELVIDASSFRTYALRSFMLDRLQIPEMDVPTGQHFVSEPIRAKNFAIMRWRNRADRLLARLGATRLAIGRGAYSEPHLHFDPDFLTLGSTVSLYGHFQSERYFSDIAGQLRGYFRPREPLGLKAQAMANMIARADMPVSIHVRRGDYVKSAETARVHGCLGAAYYRKALQVLQGTTGTRMTAFVFSDDAVAAEQVLDFGSRANVVHVRGDPDRPWEDMTLMALCRHHIIANSSFSWWGAWLNPSPDKFVIAPREWFTASELRQRNTCDLYPPDWMLL